MLDIVHTLLFQSHVPEKCRCDDVLSAFFLLNRPLFSVLNGKSPFYILHPKVEPYLIPFRGFGCTVFVHTFNPQANKLSSRAVKTAFLGYSNAQKGYKFSVLLLEESFGM